MHGLMRGKRAKPSNLLYAICLDRYFICDLNTSVNIIAEKKQRKS